MARKSKGTVKLRLLLIEGQPSDLDVLRGLQEFEIETEVPANLGAFESERLTLMDATLDPRIPRGRLGNARKYFQQGGLAGPVFADYAHHFALLDIKGYVL